MKAIKYKIPLYHSNLYVIYSDDIYAVISKYALDKSAKDCLAFAFKWEWKKPGYYVVITKNQIDVIAHEAVHIVNMVFKDKCISLDLTNDEPQAYLTGWIVKKIIKTINNAEAEKRIE